MKKILLYILVSSGALALGSCTKELATYSGPNSVYFSMTVSTSDLTKTDSSKITFAYAAASVKDTTFKLLVRTMGPLSDKDRAFRVRAVADRSSAKAGVHYEALQETYIIPAKANSFLLPITFHRTANMLTDTVQLQLELLENENFNTKLADEIINTSTKQKVSLIRYTIQVSDVLAKPKAWWDYMLGNFSRRKIIFISELAGEPLANFNDPSLLTIPKQTYLGKFTQKYLNDQAAAGNVIMDENGLPMVMGAGAQ